MNSGKEAFSLEKFEYHTYTRDHEGAARELIKLLESLDGLYGQFSISANLYATNSPTQNAHLLTRITSALSCLFSDTSFNLSNQGFQQIISWQRWISALFAASPFGNADHILRSLNINGLEPDMELSEAGFSKFCMLFTPDSEISISFDAIWSYNRQLAAALFLVLLSPRFLGTTSAHDKRERLLAWLPGKLGELDSLDFLPVGILHDVYMHCSYADLPGKHDIKKAMNPLLRNALHKANIVDVDLVSRKVLKKDKPVMIVVLEYFSVNHSIFRTHSSTLRAARDQFEMIGMAIKDYVDDPGRAVFHEFVELNGTVMDMVQQVRETAIERDADIIYMPSVGMFQLTMFLANVRFAPLQLMALGHPATTHSDCIDYVVVEEDYVGDPACFSEKLLVLSKDALPYVPSAAAPTEFSPVLREHPETVQIAVCATTMKINPRFLWACADITRRASKPVHFHFLMGFAQGLVSIQVEQILKQYLGSFVTMYPHQAYPSYMEAIRNCDMFVNPFPFGNTNGIVDTVTAGLVGICRSGPEVHEHIDEGMFGRLGLPSWMVTRTTEDYVTAAVRLIDNEDERLDLRRKLIANDGVKKLFKGRPGLFADRVMELHTLRLNEDVGRPRVAEYSS